MLVSHLWFDPLVGLAGAGLLVLNGYLLGTFVLLRVLGDRTLTELRLDAIEWAFLALASGLGLIAWITLPLGVLFPYSPAAYRVGHIILLLGALRWWRRPPTVAPNWDHARLRIGIVRVELFCWIALALTGLYAVFLSVQSLGGWDAQTLHLKAVMLWQDSGRYVPQVGGYDGLPHTVGDEQTQSGRLLLLQAALLGGLPATGPLNAVLLLLGIVGVYCLGRRWFNTEIGILGGLCYLTNPVLYRYYLVDISDYPLNLAVFLALCVAVSAAVRTEHLRWLSVASALGGILYGIKAYGLLELGLLAMISAPVLIGKGWGRAALARTPWFVLFALPWWIHHWVVFGNPVWPYLSGWLGGREPSAFWLLFTRTRAYFQLQPYFDAGAGSYAQALGRFWLHELFPDPRSVYAFSFLVVPSIAAFLLAACFRRIFLLPLVYIVAFLAVTLNTPQLFNKYMLLVAAPTAPFVAGLLYQLTSRTDRLRPILRIGLAAFVLVVAWDALAWNNRNGEMHAHPAIVQSTEPLHTLNLLPRTAVVFGNLAGTDLRYTRAYWKFRALSDTTTLFCEDWSRLWRFYQGHGITHYLVQSNEYDTFYFGRVLPYADRFDPPLAGYIREQARVFASNKSERDQYLAAHAAATDLGNGYTLHQLF